MGPGIITANIDNDASGITTYSVAGAKFGYALLWTLIPDCSACRDTGDGCKDGSCHRQGAFGLIRENYGVKSTFYMMAALLIANFGTTLANFAGWAASMDILGLSKYVMVPCRRGVGLRSLLQKAVTGQLRECCSLHVFIFRICYLRIHGKT